MAGIGFELRKIFGKQTLMSRTWGVIYASLTSVGPSLMFVLLLFILRLLMKHYSATELEMLFFTASFTYSFLVAILISALTTIRQSRKDGHRGRRKPRKRYNICKRYKRIIQSIIENARHV